MPQAGTNQARGSERKSWEGTDQVELAAATKEPDLRDSTGLKPLPKPECPQSEPLQASIVNPDGAAGVNREQPRRRRAADVTPASAKDRPVQRRCLKARSACKMLTNLDSIRAFGPMVQLAAYDCPKVLHAGC